MSPAISAEKPQPQNIAAVILAAGMSRRMGSPKALLDLGGKPLIRRLIDSVRAVPQISQITIVTGHEPQRIHQAVDQPGVNFIHNADYARGEMLSSTQAGIHSLNQPVEAFFIMLLDQPLVQPTTLEAMIRAHRAQQPTIVIPTHHGQRGHPILLDGRAIQPILALSEGSSLKEFVRSQPADQICFVNADDDPGVVSDVDTPADYRKIRELWMASDADR